MSDNKAAEYRALAIECVELAQRMPLADDRKRLMDMASRWIELAAIAEAADYRRT
jgi:hypothetical protein